MATEGEEAITGEVEGAKLLPYLLARVKELFTTYVRLPGEEYADAIALWVAHSHAIAAASTSPRLLFKSAEKASGKTRALEVLETLVPSPLATINATIAALFRLLEEEQSTLLFDEVDAVFHSKAAGDNEDLRALLNAGHRRGAMVVRVVGDGKRMRVQRFPVFAATALAAIGDLPETIESRSIIVPMRRRAPDEAIEPFRLRSVQMITEPLRDSLAVWAQRYHDPLAEARPTMPIGISDRQADCWEPLLAIADLAGGSWPVQSRRSAQRIAGGSVAEDRSVGVQLLSDIRLCLNGHERISSVGLLAKLNSIEEAPWGGWHDGSGMRPRDLARRLKPFGIESRTVRLDDGSTPKGYVREDFTDSWRRYLPSGAATTATTATRIRIPVADVTDVADVEDAARGRADDDEQRQVRAQKPVPGVAKAAAAMPDSPASLIDPRPDLAEDSARWSRLLRLAQAADDSTDGLFQALHAARCGGAQLRADLVTLWPTRGQMDVEAWSIFRKRWLIPHRQQLDKLLREAKASPEAGA